MSFNSVATNYAYLTPEERFRLVMAARARGDEVEQDRVARSGSRISLSMHDYAPHADAFRELAVLVYTELLDHIARFEEVISQVKLARASMPEDQDVPEDDGDDDSPAWQAECLQAAGYIVQTYAEGWRLFCENRGIPSHLSWEKLPGYERVQTRLSQAQKVAYPAEEFVAWLNSVKPVDHPELNASPYTPDGIARQLDEAMAFATRWWGGGT